MKKKLLYLLAIVLVVASLGVSVMASNDNKNEVESICLKDTNKFYSNAFLMPDGNVLLTGETAEILDPKTGKFRTVGKLNIHNGTDINLLKDGKVLLTGGMVFNTDQRPVTSTYLKTAEILDPKTGKYEKASLMNIGRYEHSSIILKNGQVVVFGGHIKNNKAELFDPIKKTFTLLNYEMPDQQAVLLNDGNVLFLGKDDAKIYDPTSNTLREAGSLNISRYGVKSILLNNGNVLICGGRSVKNNTYTPCEIFDNKTKTFRLISNFNEPRENFELTKLADGRVLITGGVHGEKYMSPYVIDSIEIFDPVTKEFTTVGVMKKARKNHSSVLLKDNTILLVGGRSNIVRDNWDLLRHWGCELIGYKLDSRNKDIEILKINNKGDK